MSVSFKFRSSVAFDSMDLGGRTSISVRDLRSKVADRKKLHICGDFELVLSDADTGQAFEDEDFQIPAGASVVIKRVPIGREAAHDRTVITGTARNSGGYVETHPKRPENIGIENFDDFGVDVYPNLDPPIRCYTDDIDPLNSSFDQKEGGFSRFSEVPILMPQKIEKGHLTEALSKDVGGVNFKKECDIKEKGEEMNSEHNGELRKKLSDGDFPLQVITNVELPAELRCSLCNTIFEEAVMIPCCQHSFCNKCIALALVKQSSCPKCSSTKCTIKDLLPNLSLRQAIEHFLDSQNTINVSYNNLPRYAPDGESGIQVKDVSCAVSVQRQEPAACPHSPSATGMGSNHVISEPACNNNIPFKWKDPCIDNKGGRLMIPPTGFRKFERNCYMCGSPDHLIRECPHSNRGNAVVSGGMPPYREGYWHGASFSNVPYANMYGAPAMMSFDPMMFRVTPFGMSSCMPPMYSTPPTPYGFMRVGAVPPLMRSGVEAGAYTESINNQDVEKIHKNELQERYHDSGLSEDYISGGTRRSHEQLSQPDNNNSSDNDVQRAHRKPPSHHKPRQRPTYQVDKELLSDVKRKEPHILGCERDRRTQYSEKSKSDLVDVSDGSRRHSGERKGNQYKSSKQSESDCSWKCHHRSRTSDDDELPTFSKRHNYKHYNHTGSGLEPKASTDPRNFDKDREYSHSSRHSSKIVKTRDDPLNDGTWKNRNREGHHYHRSRRIR